MSRAAESFFDPSPYIALICLNSAVDGDSFLPRQHRRDTAFQSASCFARNMEEFKQLVDVDRCVHHIGKHNTFQTNTHIDANKGC